MKVKGIHGAPALIIVILALTCAAGFADLSQLAGGGDPMLTMTVLQLIIIGIPSVFFCLLRGHDYGKRLRLKFISGRHITLALWAAGVVIFGCMALNLLMYTLFPGAFEGASALPYGGGADGDTGGAVYAVISLAILPAVLEEFLIRGIVYAEYSTYGAVTAVVLSSLAFSMLHLSFVRLPAYFFTGVFLALCANAANSIFASMLVHGANNIFVLFFEGYIYKAAGKSGSSTVLLVFVSVTLLLVFAILFFAKAEKLYAQRAQANEAPPPVRVRRENELPHFVTAVISPTFIILAVFYVILTAAG